MFFFSNGSLGCSVCRFQSRIFSFLRLRQHSSKRTGLETPRLAEAWLKCRCRVRWTSHRVSFDHEGRVWYHKAIPETQTMEKVTKKTKEVRRTSPKTPRWCRRQDLIQNIVSLSRAAASLVIVLNTSRTADSAVQNYLSEETVFEVWNLNCI